MFKRKKVLEKDIARLRQNLSELDRQFWNVRREVSLMYDKVEAMQIVKHDMAKMDALVAMMSELARRVDLAGIAELPKECACEACGCDSVLIPRIKSIDDLDAHCVKCKETNRMVDFVINTSDSGRRRAVGKCPTCNTRVYRVLRKTM